MAEIFARKTISEFLALRMTRTHVLRGIGFCELAEIKYDGGIR